MKLEYTFSKKEFIDGKLDNKYNSSLFIFIKIGYIYILPCAFMFYFFKILDINNILISLIGYTSIILLAKLMYKNNKSRIVNSVKNYDNKHIQISWDLTKDGIFINEDNIDIYLPWNLLSNIVENYYYIHLYNNRDIQIFIPKRIFRTTDELIYFKSILKDNVNKSLLNSKIFS